MSYECAYDQTVADDYCAAMQRIEQRLDVAPIDSTEGKYEIVKVPERTTLFHLTEQLALPDLCFDARLDITVQLRQLFGFETQHPPPRNLDH